MQIINGIRALFRHIRVIILAVFRNAFKAIGTVFVFVVGLFLAVSVLLYIYSPVYDFPPAKPFSGDRFYNPYAGLDLSHLIRANFHAHTRSYNGITDGRNDTNKGISNLYRFLGYGTFSISDYQKINRTNSTREWYVPAYEHGFNIRKNHQISLGARKVLWFDFPLFQGVNQEQYVLDLLHTRADLVALAHPCIRNSYTPEQLAQLTDYDLMEALNYFCNSESQWDSALSAGRRIYVIAGDDVHNLTNTNQVGGKFNMIDAPSNRRRDVLLSLKSGKSYGVDLFRIEQESYANKKKRMESLAKVIDVLVNKNLLKVDLNQKVNRIEFFGQNGRLLETVLNQNVAEYAIQPSDPYVRIRIELSDKTHYYLNPITRYSGEWPEENPRARVDLPLTWLKRITGAGLIIYIFYLWFGKKALYLRFMNKEEDLKGV